MKPLGMIETGMLFVDDIIKLWQFLTGIEILCDHLSYRLNIYDDEGSPYYYSLRLDDSNSYRFENIWMMGPCYTKSSSMDVNWRLL
jgi:hypothetical protein